MAVRVLGPTVVPRTQLPAAAMPLALEVAFPPVTDPLPEATANTTETPEMGPLAPVTTTDGAVATAVPAAAVCASPALS